MKKLFLFSMPIIGLILLLLLDNYQTKHWNEEKETEINSISDLLKIKIENSIQSRFAALEGISSLFIVHPETNIMEFRSFAKSILSLNPSIRALQYADSLTKVTYVYPSKDNEITIKKPMYLLNDPKRRSYVKKAIESKKATLQGPFNLRQGGKGVVVRSPIFSKGKFSGLAIGVYDFSTLIKEVEAELNLNKFLFNIENSDGDIIYGINNSATNYSTRTVFVADIEWFLKVTWNSNSLNSPILTRLIIFGLGLGFLISSFFAIFNSLNRSLKLEKVVSDRTKDLQNEKERLLVTIQSIGDGVITTDNKGKVVLLNNIAEKLTGWKTEDAIGNDLSEIFKIVNTETRKLVKNPVLEVLKSGKIVGLANHTVLISKDNTEYQIADSAAPIKNSTGIILGVILVFRDVTNEYLMQEKIIKNELELLKVDKLRSIGTLAGGIAHDFNNILTGVYGNISLAKMCIVNNKDIYEYLDNAEKSMNRAIRLTKQLLTFSKGGSPVKENVSISEIINEVVRFDLSGSNVKPIFTKQENLWNIEVDKGQICQVFSNLTINANQAMPDGGNLYISMENIEILDNEIVGLLQGNYIKVTVQDEGIGIHKKYINKVFDPYFTTKQTGNGLGLATSYSIIKKHNGHIKIDSTLDKGTTFTIYLPASKIKNIDINLHEKNDLISTKQPERILIMDDEEMICNLVQKMLGKIGIASDTASDGKEAIEKYKKSIQDKKPFDTIILDLTIPGGMGGKEAIKHILDINPDAKVIVSSGYSASQGIVNFQELGFIESLEKPFTIKNLKKVLSKVLI